MSNIQFHHESCVDTLNRMIENNQKVDLVITSPPYNMNLRIRANPKTGKRVFCSRQLDKSEFSSSMLGLIVNHLHSMIIYLLMSFLIFTKKCWLNY